MRIPIVFVLLTLFISGCATPAHKRNKEWNKEFTYIKMVHRDFEQSATLKLDCKNYDQPEEDGTTSQKGAASPNAANDNAGVAGSDASSAREAASMKPGKARSKSKKPAHNWVDQVNCFMQDKDKTDAQKAELRNRIVESFVTFVNHAYGDFEHDSVFFRESTNATLDAINLGLTAGTSVFGGTALGAAATGAQGFQHSIDKNFYNSETAFVINGKMQALRLEQLTKIREREVLPVNCPAPAAPEGSTQGKGSQPKCYPFSEAMNDVQELFYAGTVHRALQDISSQTSEQTSKAQEKLSTLNDQNVPSSKPQATPSPAPDSAKPGSTPEKPKP